MDKLPECAKCRFKLASRACISIGGAGLESCPTQHMKKALETASKEYEDPKIKTFAKQAAVQEAECYAGRDKKPYVCHPIKPRLEETYDFAQKMGYKKIGIAYCAGLQSEASKLQKVLELNDFNVVSVICKVGCIPKEAIGVTDAEKECIGEFESMCNPIAQAEILNEAETDFNILLGLCVGHDSLFFKYVKAMTTVFATKDRVLGHNPLAALYNLNTYYERLYRKKV